MFTMFINYVYSLVIRILFEYNDLLISDYNK